MDHRTKSAPENTSPLFGIAGLGTRFGDVAVDVDDLARRGICGQKRVAAIRAAGSRQFFRSTNLSVEVLAIEATRKALDEVDVAPADVEIIVFCSTVFECTALYPDITAQRIADKLGCWRAKTLALQHAYCVSPFVALQLLKQYFTDADRPAWGVVVCADVIVETAEFLRPIGDLGVHSDGAAAVVVTNDRPKWALLDTELYIDPTRFQGRNDDGSIQHDMRYFILLAKVLKTLLKRCDMESLKDIAIYPNNLGAPSWHRIGQLLSIDAESVDLAEMPRVGHVFGADPFMNLAAATATTDRPYALLVASGIAGAFGAALMRRCL